MLVFSIMFLALAAITSVLAGLALHYAVKTREPATEIAAAGLGLMTVSTLLIAIYMMLRVDGAL